MSELIPRTPNLDLLRSDIQAITLLFQYPYYGVALPTGVNCITLLPNMVDEPTERHRT